MCVLSISQLNCQTILHFPLMFFFIFKNYEGYPRLYCVLIKIFLFMVFQKSFLLILFMHIQLYLFMFKLCVKILSRGIFFSHHNSSIIFNDVIFGNPSPALFQMRQQVLMFLQIEFHIINLFKNIFMDVFETITHETKLFDVF